VNTVEESKRINTLRDPAILIAGSGMATGGRVLHHLEAYAPDARNMVLFVGFQAAGTRGAALVSGAREIKIHGQLVAVNAEVAQLDGFSAHADADELLGWLRGFDRPPLRTFVTHGEPTASEVLRARIASELGWDATCPRDGESVLLGAPA
jgi:metallo-beta-lactamase family protein